ncbi:MAG: hypothetical protein ACLQBX_10230 [Candidatus Limnocylindrales bacterium]
MRDVVVVSYPGDEHGDALEETLVARGARVLRCSLARVPAVAVTWELGNHFRFDETEIVRGKWSGVWRRPGNLELRELDARYADFAAAESRDAFRGGLLAADVDWLNSPVSLWRAEHKMVQLRTAHDLGLPCPATIVTNDATVARAFLDRHPAVVVKAVRYGLVATSPLPEFAWTSRIRGDDDLELNGIPIVLQAEIVAREHLRVVTVGDDVFAYRLTSSDLDWRVSLENHGRWEPCLSTESVSCGARLLAAALGLGFTSQDWVVDSDGHATFVEANPNGQWLFLETSGDRRVTAAMVEWLVERRTSP